LKWSVKALLPFVLLACSTNNEPGWPRASASEALGFHVLMPLKSEVQRNSVEILGEPVDIVISIVGDSGVIYVATAFELTPAMLEFPDEERHDLLWSAFAGRIPDARPIPDGEPLPGDGVHPVRSGWFQEDEGNLMAMALHTTSEKGVLLTSGTPVEFAGSIEKDRMRRFFNTFRFE
jgi:hypothetical protein